MADYFFELLTEEIPASMHEGAQAALRQRLTPIVEQIAGDPARILITTTPRRIAFHLPALAEREADREQEVKGPPKKAAFDAGGQPTPALTGFLRKNGASATDLIDGGDYVTIRRSIKGRDTGAILQERVPEAVASLRWPKMMRWGLGAATYIRPIHSIISLYGGHHLPIEILGVPSGTTTVGHRTLAPKKIEVTSYDGYVSALDRAKVVVDGSRRREAMAERARVLATGAGGSPADDASIWAQWQYLTEYPGVVCAEFRPAYLALPEEVLVTVMRVHQKQLPIRDAAGGLTNSFLAVMDNEGDPDGNAAYGNSFVTNARFADAQFFYETDRRRPLADRLEQLVHLQFQEKLGNYRDKSRRIEAIARAICTDAGIDPSDAADAARLCKADLVTEMVKEFTDLQGNIGGIYAREEGQREAVWQAIYDHYLPLNPEGDLPRGVAGAVVSLADKIDTLAGFFSIGAKPTGSRDPFALRRAAQGIVQILLNRDERRVEIGPGRLIDIALEQSGRTVGAAVRDEVLAFFAERVRTLLEQSRFEFAYDEIAAAMEAGWDASLTDLVDRIAALQTMRGEANFLSILDSAKRIANITQGHPSTSVDPRRLESDSERRLSEMTALVGEQINELIAERHYSDALRSFAGMAPELEAFFREVMVMVEDEAIRNNRMALLRKIGGAVMRIADVTKIVVDRRDYRP